MRKCLGRESDNLNLCLDYVTPTVLPVSDCLLVGEREQTFCKFSIRNMDIQVAYNINYMHMYDI